VSSNSTPGGGNQPDALEGAEGESDSNWLVSYADMMTLLMSFFALMFSFSKVDQDAFDKVRNSVAKQFGSVVIMPFAELNDKLKKVIADKKLENKVQVVQNGNSISIIFQGSTLFAPGSTDLNLESKDTISDFLDILHDQALTFPIIVEGHTDDIPISSDRFPSNWELSSDRAALILRMLEAKGFPRQHLQSQGYADTRPVAPNRDDKGNPVPENQSLNRRITIKILKDFPTS
jgi:chemotaxis protein MotB